MVHDMMLIVRMTKEIMVAKMKAGLGCPGSPPTLAHESQQLLWLASRPAGNGAASRPRSPLGRSGLRLMAAPKFWWNVEVFVRLLLVVVQGGRHPLVTAT
jgi:hypothetical protein